MGYIFIDESGDLGFDFEKKGTSKFFIITFLFAENPREVDKSVKKAFRTLTKQECKTHCGVLHANKEKFKVRNKLLNELAKKDVYILSICLNKEKVYTKNQEQKAVLYNYVTNILLDRIYSKKLLDPLKNVNLIASKRETNKFLNQNFESYLSSQVQQKHGASITINIKTPAESKGLQAVDFVSWALFRNKEHGEDSYYNLIKSKIIEESSLF